MVIMRWEMQIAEQIQRRRRRKQQHLNSGVVTRLWLWAMDCDWPRSPSGATYSSTEKAIIHPCGELWLVERWWWDTFPPTTTRHRGKLWLFLCHFMWHKTFSWPCGARVYCLHFIRLFVLDFCWTYHVTLLTQEGILCEMVPY